MDKKVSTKDAIALWLSNKPEDELTKMGFVQVDEANLEQDDICLIVDFQTNTIGFGMVQKLMEKHITFISYEEFGGFDAARVQFPKKNILVNKLNNSAEDHEDSSVPPIK